MSDQDNAAEVLHPERTLTIGDKEVTVREFSFRDGLELGPLMQPMMSRLDAVVADGSDLSGLFDVLYAHHELLELMLLKATGESKEWLDTLDALQGDRLVMALWTVNGDFFTRRLATRRIAAKAGMAARVEQESKTSS